MGSWGWVCAGRGGGGEGGGGGRLGVCTERNIKKRREFDSQTSSKRSSPATLSPYTLLRPRFCSDRATFSCNESPALRQSKQKMKSCMSYILSGNNIAQFRRNDGCCLRIFGFAFGDCCDIVFGDCCDIVFGENNNNNNSSSGNDTRRIAVATEQAE